MSKNVVKSVPEALQTKENDQVLKYLSPLICHSDIVEPLIKALEKYSDVYVFCPDGANFKYCFWYVDNRIFAFAEGMQKISLKLPEIRHEAVALDGGVKCDSAGEEWHSFPYNSNHLIKWASVSYGYAKNV